MKYTTVNINNYNEFATKEMEKVPYDFIELKRNNPSNIFLFPIGDFYEGYCDDASIISELLGIGMTVNLKGYRMAGFHKVHLHRYVYELIKAGKTISICEP